MSIMDRQLIKEVRDRVTHFDFLKEDILMRIECNLNCCIGNAVP